MKSSKNSFFTIVLLVVLIGMQSCGISGRILNTPTFSEQSNINCIIEIPAGTSKKIEFNKESKRFTVDVRDGNDRIIEYLPYPGNYGFIASTYSDPTVGGDGDPLDMLLLCESIKTGTIIEAKPIAMLKILDAGESDYKVICIPADEKLRTVSAETFDEFLKKYPNALQLIETWFSNYDHADSVIVQGWGDDSEALAEIKRLSVAVKK